MGCGNWVKRSNLIDKLYQIRDQYNCKEIEQSIIKVCEQCNGAFVLQTYSNFILDQVYCILNKKGVDVNEVEFKVI